MIKSIIREAGYSSRSIILRDLEIEAETGETVLIAGESGSGKTTYILAVTGVLSNLLRGYVNAEIRVDDLDPLNIDDYRYIPYRVGVVLQDPEKQLTLPTPWDEISFTLENLGYSSEEITKRTSEALDRIGLRNKAFLNTEFLSGGEKRRVVLAASTIHEPGNLFLDEPSASIDPWGIREIRRFIRENKEKRTILVVEHKPGFFIDLIDRVVVISRGEVRSIIDVGKSDLRSIQRDLELSGIDPFVPREIKREPRKILSERKILETKDLVIGYGEEILIENIDLEIYESEIIALVGPNGSGKTTLLKTLLGWLRPLSGDIKILGERVGSSGKRVYRGVFYVPQQPDYLFTSSSVYRELRECSRVSEEDLERIIPWYKEIKYENPYRLSHGQRRWLAISISLLCGGEILLMDEPTAGLDNHLYTALRDLLRDLVNKYKRSVLISTHDPRVIADLADRVYYIDSVKKRIYEEDPGKILRFFGDLIEERI